ncbi:MAG TPA: acetylglutamate kinase [Clostridiales bacterium]|nr:acetylglutamate kinase [Clostridiales bacterium]
MYSYTKGTFPYNYVHTPRMRLLPYQYSCFSPSVISKAQADLSNHLRLLWEQHVVWTRLTIISIVFSLPDVDLVTNRLLRNPKDFEALLRPLYGDRVASWFADLFTSHLVIAAELVNAAKAGDTRAAAEAEKRWYANADQIAAFLGSINPYWSVQQWKTMLHEHLALTKSEAVNMINGNYAESIALFDQIEKQALEMADVMTHGIIQQFPNYFM